MSKPCKDCGAEIDFVRNADETKWIPVTPGTDTRHRCDLPQTCSGCQKTFRGAPWMETCPECYRNGGKAPESPGAAPRPSRKAEPLQAGFPDLDDDAPPF